MHQSGDIQQYLAVIKRRKYQFILPAVIVFFLATVVTFLLPPVYKSTATILIEAQEIPSELVQSTVTGYVEQRLQAITQLVLSRTRLSEIINRFELYQDLRRRYSTEEIVENMREDIQMEPITAEVINPQSGRPGSATIAFTLSYEGKDPRKVAQVANVLTSLYLEENLRNREEKARTTFEFLENQLTQLRQEIVVTEKRIAAFKEKHINALPELMQINLQTMERLRREIDAKEEEIKTLVNRKIYLEGQLASVEPAMYNVTLDGKRVMTPKEELEALRSQYLSLRSTHSEMHPDVISLKKRVEAMESEVSTRDTLRELYRQLQEKEKELAQLSKNYSGNHPDVIKLNKEVAGLREEVKNLSEKQTVLKAENEKPENPAYINLQTQIASTRMEIDNAREELTLLKKKYDDYQQRVENTPQVEQEYRALQRDYTNAQAKYQETMNRLLAAREAKGLEESRMAEKFTIIDPPVMPEKPDRPNRLALLLVGMVLSVGSGVGFGSMAEYMDRSVRSPDELAQVSGQPVLAVIPYLETPGDLLKRRRRRWAIAGGSIGLFAVGLTAVHFLYRPLDILWLKIVRRFYLSF
jgi:uncharacterized protein involved in exopolysaccharide biosynthesis